MLLEILTEDERNRASDLHTTDDFITRFEAWAALKTDAPAYTVRAAALQALSMAAGDTVVLPPLWDGDPMRLNLFIMVVGPSTTMRKTTVLNMARGLLPKNQQTQQDYIRILDDVSIQALNKAMAEQGKTMAPILFSVDEVAGMFQMARKKDHFLKGLDKLLMKAFDHSPVHIVRSNARIDVPQGCFVNVFAASTPEPLAEALGANDVESGLLPRFIVFDARDAIRGERVRIHDRKGRHEEWQAGKEGLAAFLYDIAKNRADGIPTGANLDDGSADFPVTELPLNDAALERLDDIDRLFHETAGKDSDALGAIKGRAFTHIFRLSGLYALAREGRKATVSLDDVLRAAWLMETAGSDLVRMAEEVGANAQERLINSVMEYLRSLAGGRAKASTISTKFKLGKRDMDALLGDLVVRELVVPVNDAGAVYWKRA